MLVSNSTISPSGWTSRDRSRQVFGPAADYYGEATIDPALKWAHDFVDPWSPGAGSTEQVVAILSAGLGIGEPEAGGVLVPPLVEAGSSIT